MYVQATKLMKFDPKALPHTFLPHLIPPGLSLLTFGSCVPQDHSTLERMLKISSAQ